MAKGGQQRLGECAAARHVRLLLLRSGAYRSLWEAKAEKITPGEVSQAGVCRVLADYLWDEGLEADSKTDLPRVLKDPVSRAFRGLGLSPKLLRTIVAAFKFTDGDADYTWALYRGDEHPTVVTGTLPPPEKLRAIKYPNSKLSNYRSTTGSGLMVYRPVTERRSIYVRV
jgi:hypothetical protein